ncbi:hypothetical protein CGZ60_07405 [Neisseria animalis]|nr:hypothetical protein CGZ60_07405 [Neisseria animalis]
MVGKWNVYCPCAGGGYGESRQEAGAVNRRYGLTARWQNYSEQLAVCRRLLMFEAVCKKAMRNTDTICVFIVI